MTINKRQRKTILIALRIAIDSERNFIDCHRTKWSNTKGIPYKIIPKENLSIVRKTQRQIDRFIDVILYLEEEETK